MFCIAWRDLDPAFFSGLVKHLEPSAASCYGSVSCHTAGRFTAHLLVSISFCLPTGTAGLAVVLLCCKVMLQGQLSGTAQLIKPPANPVPLMIPCFGAHWHGESGHSTSRARSYCYFCNELLVTLDCCVVSGASASTAATSATGRGTGTRLCTLGTLGR